MRISRLQYITTNAAHAQMACKGGVDWVQLRLKDVPYGELYTVAREVQAVCKKYAATFIINDNVELALSLNADGVHLGKADMPPLRARALLGDNFIIGRTANTVDDVLELSALSINYIGLGPFRYTTTKQNLSPVLGLAGYLDILSQVGHSSLSTPPVIAIGGISENDIPGLLSAGVHGIAVSGAISNAADVTHAAKKMVNSVVLQVQL